VMRANSRGKAPCPPGLDGGQQLRLWAAGQD
jgi:hypothetical protein